jgi:hypothetical protein
MSEIQKADPKARRVGLLILGGGTLLGVVLITITGKLRPDFEAWVKQDVGARLRMVVAALTLLTAGPALGVAGYLWRLGQRIVRAERYPPPGLRVVRDTLVVVGQDARWRGQLVQAFGAVIGLTGLLLAFFVWRLLSLLEGAAA